MKITKTLLRASVLAGMLAFPFLQASAQRTADEGKNFTVSDTPDTTVFNLKTPSQNRHIHDYSKKSEPTPTRKPAPAPKAKDPCAPGTVTDYVDRYLVRLEKTAPATVALDDPFDYQYTAIAKDKVKKVVVEEQIPEGTEYVSSSPEAEVKGGSVVWTLYNMQKGERRNLSMTVKATSVADLSNCATITAYPEACTTTQVGVPELALEKTTPKDQVLVDSGVPWNITVTNTGNFCAYDVVVTDMLPSGVAHESGNSELVTELGTLAPGESRDISINTTATAVGRVVIVATRAGCGAAEVVVAVRAVAGVTAAADALACTPVVAALRLLRVQSSHRRGARRTPTSRRSRGGRRGHRVGRPRQGFVGRPPRTGRRRPCRSSPTRVRYPAIW